MSLTITITENINKIKKNIKWCPSVIDNEHMCKKKSKCCCHYISKDKKNIIIPSPENPIIVIQKKNKKI